MDNAEKLIMLAIIILPIFAAIGGVLSGRIAALTKRVAIIESVLQKAIAENLGLTVLEAIAAVDRSIAAEAAWADQHPSEAYSAHRATCLETGDRPQSRKKFTSSAQAGNPGVNLS